jgi:hypothetical protein
VSPGVVLIRHLSLRIVKADAEQRFHRQAERRQRLPERVV